MTIAVRPEHLHLSSPSETATGELRLTGEVTRQVYLGETTQVHVAGAGGQICLLSVPKRQADTEFRVGTSVSLGASAEHCRIFP